MDIYSKEIKCSVSCSVGNRYATCLVDNFSKIESTVLIGRKWGRFVNAKSLIGILSLQIQAGELLTLIVKNENEEQLNKDCERIVNFMEE